MRRFRGLALTAIVVAFAPLPEPTAPWQGKARERLTAHRHIIARVVRDAYIPWRVIAGVHSDTHDPPAPPPTDDPHDRGRALLRRGEISQAIPELREAARGGDPAALTDFAAALISEEDLLWLDPGERPPSRVDRSSRHASVLEAIAALHRAIEQQPGALWKRTSTSLSRSKRSASGRGPTAVRRSDPAI